MAFGLEAIMPIEFLVPSLRVQVTARLPEVQSEEYRLEQLLELGEDRIESMTQLEQRQRQQKAFVDRHRKGLEKESLSEKVLAISHEAWEEPTPSSPPAADPHPASAPPPPQNQRKRAIPETCQEWEEETNPEDHPTDDVTIR